MGAQQNSESVMWAIARGRMRHLIFLTVVIAAGCGADADPEAWVVRDSAGIRIVEYSALPARDDPDLIWSLDTLRVVDTAPPPGSSEPILFDPRRFTLLSDGSLVVMDGGLSPITVISPSGETRRLSSWGQGPGEIQSGFALLAPAGSDAFDVFDTSNQRVTRFRVDGAVLSEAPLDFGNASFQWLEVLQSTGEAFAHLWYVDRSQRASSISLGDSVRRIHPEWPETRRSIPLGDRGAHDPSNARTRLFDSRLFFAALEGGEVVVGRNDLAEYRHFDADGRLRTKIRVPLEPREINVIEHREILREFGRVAGAQASGVAVDINSHYPLVTLLKPLGDSVFALEHSRRSLPEGDPELAMDQRAWRLFSVAGSYLGSTVLPTGFMPQLTLDLAVIGVQTDEVGRQKVIHLKLVPPGQADS